MLRLLAVLILLCGALISAAPWLPLDRLPERFLPPGWPYDVRIGYGLLAAAVILWLLGGRRRAKVDHSGQQLRDLLEQRGFEISEMGGEAWQARGTWNGTTIQVRKATGAAANRFGRAWVVLLQVPGNPQQPWPLPPDQAQLVGEQGRSFDVVLPETGLAGGLGRFEQRVDAVLGARQGEL